MNKSTSEKLKVKNNPGLEIATQTNFYISFSHIGIEIKIQSLNGDDIFKLATAFENLLQKKGIPYNFEKK